MHKEELLSADVLHLPHKSAAMYIKSYNLGRCQIHFDPAQGRYELFDLFANPQRTNNQWADPDCHAARADMVWALLFGRWGDGTTLDAANRRGLMQ